MPSAPCALRGTAVRLTSSGSIITAPHADVIAEGERGAIVAWQGQMDLRNLSTAAPYWSGAAIPELGQKVADSRMRSTADLRPDRTAGCAVEPFPAPWSSRSAASDWARRPPVLNTAHASQQPPTQRAGTTLPPHNICSFSAA